MWKGTLDQQIQAMQERVDALQRYADASPAQPDIPFTSALEELKIALEELYVASEELHQQNEKLAASRQEVEAEHQRYQDLFEFAPDGYVVTDAKGVIQEANHAAAALLNVDQHFLVGKPLDIFVAKGEREKFRTKQRRLMPVERVQDWEVRLQPRRAPPFPAAITVVAIHDSQNQPTGLRWMIRDISERKYLERQLVQTEKLQALVEMANGVAHNFNNFLVTILGRTHLLLTRVEDAELQRDLRIIEQVGRDAAETVKRLQLFSRGESLSLSSPFNLNDLITNTLEMTRPLWKDKAQQQGIQITPALELAEIPLTMGNPPALREVLTNLIFNAIDAMPQGGTILCMTWLEDSTLHCSITDSGTGIPPEIQPRIFEPFFTTKGVGKGLGMGLSTAYGILTVHGGTISVESQPDQGTTFTFTLPLITPLQTVAPPPSIPSAPPRSGLILLIEDEELNRELLHEVLQTAGYQVTTAANGREALAYLQQHTFDLVLTDLGLPEMDGWEVCRQIRKQHTTLPIIMMSGWGPQVTEEEQEKLHALRISRFLTKPFNIPHLLQTIQELLSEEDGY